MRPRARCWCAVTLWRGGGIPHPPPHPSAPHCRFWVLAKALGVFVRTRGGLPVTCSIPDMVSNTTMYTELQRVYLAQWGRDLEAFRGMVRNVLVQIQFPEDFVSEEESKRFCKSAPELGVVEFGTWQQEMNSATANKEVGPPPPAPRTPYPAQTMQLAVMPGVGDSGPMCPLLWYFMLRACDRFHGQNGRYPGTGGATGSTITLNMLEQDADKLDKVVRGLVKSLGMEACAISRSHSKEMVRYGGGEIHAVAAVMGGLAAQEATKLITHQFVPLKNTFVFNGITGEGGSYVL